jgi:hypothetical protein
MYIYLYIYIYVSEEVFVANLPSTDGHPRSCEHLVSCVSVWVSVCLCVCVCVCVWLVCQILHFVFCVFGVGICDSYTVSCVVS